MKLRQLERADFWGKWKISLKNKKIHKTQAVSTDIVFRFLILEDIFHINLKMVEAELEIAKGANFAFNLKEILPQQVEIQTLRKLLSEQGYYGIILKKCQEYVQKENKTPLPTPMGTKPKIPNKKLGKCPNCKSSYIFRQRPSIILRIFSKKIFFICSECNMSFKKQVMG